MIFIDAVFVLGLGLRVAPSLSEYAGVSAGCANPNVLQTVFELQKDELVGFWGKESARNPHTFRGISELGADGNWTLCRAALVFYKETVLSDIYGTGWNELTFDYQFVPTNDGGVQVQLGDIVSSVRTDPLPGALTTKYEPSMIDRYRDGSFEAE